MVENNWLIAVLYRWLPCLSYHIIPSSKTSPKMAPKKKMKIVNCFEPLFEYNSSKKSSWDVEILDRFVVDADLSSISNLEYLDCKRRKIELVTSIHFELLKMNGRHISDVIDVAPNFIIVSFRNKSLHKKRTIFKKAIMKSFCS